MTVDEAKRARQDEGWIRRADWSPAPEGLRRPLHNPSFECRLPMIQALRSVWPLASDPDGTAGDIWRCPECSRLWRIVDFGPHRGLHWDRVPGWLRLLHWAGWWPA